MQKFGRENQVTVAIAKRAMVSARRTCLLICVFALIALSRSAEPRRAPLAKPKRKQLIARACKANATAAARQANVMIL